MVDVFCASCLRLLAGPTFGKKTASQISDRILNSFNTAGLLLFCFAYSVLL